MVHCVHVCVCVFVSIADKTVKLWKVSERRKRTDGFNLRDEMGSPVDPSSITSLRVPVFKPMELMVEASPRRVFANAHTYHINSISVNSDGATYLSADDLRINLWHMENNDQSFSILAAFVKLCVRTCLTGSFVYAVVNWFNMSTRTVGPCCCSCKLCLDWVFSIGILFCFTGCVLLIQRKTNGYVLTVTVKMHVSCTPYSKNEDTFHSC